MLSRATSQRSSLWSARAAVWDRHDTRCARGDGISVGGQNNSYRGAPAATVTPTRTGMALPAAIAAMIVLAGLAALANISATAAIRESRALRDVTVERMQRATLRARALYHIGRSPRGDLIAGNESLGMLDTTLVISALT